MARMRLKPVPTRAAERPAPDPSEELAAALLERIERSPAPPPSFLAMQRYRVRSCAVDLPGLSVVLSGSKRIIAGGRTATAAPGRFVMLHRPGYFDVENVPGPDGRYLGWFLTFPWRVIAAARVLLGDRPASQGQAVSTGALAPLAAELSDLLSVQSDPAPDALRVEHRLLGVLVALARTGQDQFLRATDASFSSRIRALVAGAPVRPWSSRHFEDALHVSGATLRRKLAEEGTSLRALLREARLHFALAMLQTTRQPVKAVAAASGYRSLSAFRRNFEARFGVPASRVSNG